jgi:hypothetical protein
MTTLYCLTALGASGSLSVNNCVLIMHPSIDFQFLEYDVEKLRYDRSK